MPGTTWAFSYLLTGFVEGTKEIHIFPLVYFIYLSVFSVSVCVCVCVCVCVFIPLGPPTNGVHFIYTYSPQETWRRERRKEPAQKENDGYLLKEGKLE